MILAQRNALLRRVSRSGASEDYGTAGEDYDVPASSDTTPTGGADVFIGSADAFYGSRRATMTEGSMLNRVRIDYVVVPGDLGFDFATGDVVTIEQNGASFQRKVREFADRELAFTHSMPIRLDLEDE